VKVNKQGSPHNPARVSDFLYTKHTSEEGDILLLQLYIALPLFGKWQIEGGRNKCLKLV